MATLSETTQVINVRLVLGNDNSNTELLETLADALTPLIRQRLLQAARTIPTV